MSNRIQSLIGIIVALPLMAAPLLSQSVSPSPSPSPAASASASPSPAPSATPSAVASPAVGAGHDLSIFYTSNIIGEVDPCG